MKKKIYFFIVSFLLLFGVFLYETIRFNDGKMHIVFCDVGQGDAVFVRTPKGADILVDGGPDNKVLSCLSSHMPFYDRDLELVFLTHPDSDHMAGLIEIVRRYSVKRFYTSDIQGDTDLYREFVRLLKERSINTEYTWMGDRMKVSDNVEIETLWPPKQSSGFVKNNKNIFSLVQHLSFGDFDMLLTGDTESAELNAIMSGVDNIEVLKMPHHGAKNGVDSQLFKEFHPALAVISVGKDNRYGHPAEGVLKLLQDYKIRYKRTDRDGKVEIVVSKEKYEVF